MSPAVICGDDLRRRAPRISRAMRAAPRAVMPPSKAGGYGARSWIFRRSLSTREKDHRERRVVDVAERRMIAHMR